MLKKILAMSTAMVLSAIVSAPAQAAYVVTFSQVGGNVVANGSGSLNFSSLAFSNFNEAYVASINPSMGYFAAGNQGPTGGSEDYSDVYHSITGPTAFGTGGLTLASSTTGSVAGIGVSNSELDVPGGYAPGTPILPSVTTFNNSTLASLGLTAGTYVYSFGTGSNADSFTINIPGVTSAVPEAATWAMMMVGLGIVGGSLRRRRRVTTRVVFA